MAKEPSPTSTFSGLRLQRGHRSQPGVWSWLIAAGLVATPLGWAQYPYPVMPPNPPGFVTGSTPGATLRNASAAVTTQAGMVRTYAGDWARRAGSAGYNAANFQQDYNNVQFQFGALRQQFNAMATHVVQLGRPRADNAVAELDAGLNIIGELFTFLQNEYSAGTLDPRTIVRTARALEDAIREWERELKRNSSRLGVMG